MFFICLITSNAFADYTVASGTTVDASTLTGQTGVLTINGTLIVSINTYLSGITSVIINGTEGNIFWTANKDLKFNDGVTFDIFNSGTTGGLQPTGQNAAMSLTIGILVIAVSNDNSNNAAFSFAEFNGIGGLPRFDITGTASPVCYGSNIKLTLTPLNTVINYDCVWTVDNGGTLTPASNFNFNTPINTALTAVNSATAVTYSISASLKKAGDPDPIVIKSFSVTVNPAPATATSANANPAAICAGNSSNIKASTIANSIDWFKVSTGGVSIGNSNSNVDFSVTPTSTVTYYAASKINATGCLSLTRVPVTVNVSPVAVGGNLNSDANVCAGSNNSVLTLNGFTGNIVRWESSLDNFVTAGVPITNASNSYTVTNISSSTSYRVFISSGVCPSVYSPSVILRVSNPGTWLGVNTNWNSPLNWCNGILPTSNTDVTIPAGLSIYPIINITAFTRNIIVASSASVIVTNIGVLKIAGSITSINVIDASAGTIELNGNNTQNISGDNFKFNSIANLVVNNSKAAASVSNPSVAVIASGGALKIFNAVRFSNLNNAVFKTNDNLTLASSNLITARIADITNNDVNSGNLVSGKVTIERYIPAKRAWRLLTGPVLPSNNVKISASWQEGAARVTDPSIINSSNNPYPGYGTHITYGNPAINGYDQGINGNTNIKYLTNTGWDGIPVATNNGAAGNSGYITDQPGYFLFVRGDRGTALSMGTAAPLSATTLRIKGEINQGVVAVPLTTKFKVGFSDFMVVGNPYPSAINYHNVMQNPANITAGFADAFYLWDPNITGSNGVGGWVAMSYNSSTGLYDRTVVAGGSSSINDLGEIQSGSAFVIDYSGASASISIKESNKTSLSNTTQFRPVQQLRAILFAKNTDNSLSVNDAALQTFNPSFNNDADKMDMRKLNNFAENISIVNNNQTLVIERRKPFKNRDTVLFNISQMKLKDYKLVLAMDKLELPSGSIVVFEDDFTAQKKLVNISDSFKYDFKIINEPASYNPKRFKLVIRPSVTFLQLGATVTNSDVKLNFEVSDEFNMKRYEIEKSADAISYIVVENILSKGNSNNPVTYNWVDKNATAGIWHYRIKSINNNAVVVYSNAIKVSLMNDLPGMYVFPNPVFGDQFGVQFNNMESGWYNVQLFEISGKMMTDQLVYINAGNNTKSIESKQHLFDGNYLLKMTGHGGKIKTLKLLVANK